MLSDAIKQMRETVRAGRPADPAGLMLTLQAFEIEARNMEERLALVTGRIHVPLDGRLVAAPSPIIDIIHGGKNG